MVELMYIIQFSRRYCLPLTFYCYTRPNKPHFRNVQDGGGYILSQKELSIHSLLAVPLLPLVALLRAWSIPDPIWHQILPSSLGHIIIDTLATFLSLFHIFTATVFSPVLSLLPLFTSMLPPWLPSKTQSIFSFFLSFCSSVTFSIPIFFVGPYGYHPYPCFFCFLFLFLFLQTLS